MSHELRRPVFGRGSPGRTRRTAPVPRRGHPFRARYEGEGWLPNWLDKLDRIYLAYQAAMRARIDAYYQYWVLVDRTIAEAPPDDWESVLLANEGIQRAWDACLQSEDEEHKWISALSNPERIPKEAARRIPAARRQAVIQQWERDGRICGICGKVVAEGEQIHVHHKKAVWQGGTNELDNLTVAHAKCNESEWTVVFPWWGGPESDHGSAGQLQED